MRHRRRGRRGDCKSVDVLATLAAIRFWRTGWKPGMLLYCRVDARPRNRGSICGGAWLVGSPNGGHYMRRQRPPEALERELSNRLHFHSILDRHQHAGTDQDLPRLCFIAKSRGNIRHRPDSGLVEPALEADGSERSEAMRNPDAEANVVPKPPPYRAKAQFAPIFSVWPFRRPSALPCARYQACGRPTAPETLAER